AVFHNRLKEGMRLQSDPTVIYGIKDFDGNLRKSDLREKTPYNTYTIKGLPPGSICNPGMEAIKAALYPAPVDFLYFVSKNNGSHQFSSNLKDHNAAVVTYQIKRRK
ncbi:MAG: endolytic transglycosylase MltG, partial [Syntrophobacterales bacterium]|nr:endolytic transglycosylase MltG [Syntrophobacterales bacterium]